jgi:hypothetical protein
MATTIQVRRGTTAQWTTGTKTLVAGEIGLDTTTGQFKVGPGNWADLPYFSAVDVSAPIASTVSGGKATLSLSGGFVRNTGTTDTLSGTNPYPKVTLKSSATGPTGAVVGDLWIKY